MPVPISAHRTLRAAGLLAVVLLGSAAGAASAPAATVGGLRSDPVVTVSDSFFGRSGRLRYRILRSDADPATEVEPLIQAFGEAALERPGILSVYDSSSGEPFHFVSLVPFAEKQNGRVGVYRGNRRLDGVRADTAGREGFHGHRCSFRDELAIPESAVLVL